MQGFSPVSNNKLYIQIYTQIRDAIMKGSFSVGDKLPSEKELCQMFNVSRVPVREALSALELSGLVESVHGAGVYVKQLNVVNNDWVHEIDPQEIIRVRQILEPEVAREAAKNISDLEHTMESDFYRQGNYDEHVRIGKAILAGDAEAAYEMMKQHMLQLEIRYWK